MKTKYIYSHIQQWVNLLRRKIKYCNYFKSTGNRSYHSRNSTHSDLYKTIGISGVVKILQMTYLLIHFRSLYKHRTIIMTTDNLTEPTGAPMWILLIGHWQRFIIRGGVLLQLWSIMQISTDEIAFLGHRGQTMYIRHIL